MGEREEEETLVIVKEFDQNKSKSLTIGKELMIKLVNFTNDWEGKLSKLVNFPSQSQGKRLI